MQPKFEVLRRLRHAGQQVVRVEGCDGPIQVRSEWAADPQMALFGTEWQSIYISYPRMRLPPNLSPFIPRL